MYWVPIPIPIVIPNWDICIEYYWAVVWVGLKVTRAYFLPMVDVEFSKLCLFIHLCIWRRNRAGKQDPNLFPHFFLSCKTGMARATTTTKLLNNTVCKPEIEWQFTVRYDDLSYRACYDMCFHSVLWTFIGFSTNTFIMKL